MSKRRVDKLTVSRRIRSLGMRSAWYMALGLASGVALWLWLAGMAKTQDAATVSGVVVDADGPVSGAVVRQQTTANSTTSAADGSFTLGGLTEGITVTITAWSEGNYPSGVQVVPPQMGVTITLRPHPTGDNPDHEWYTSMPDPDQPIGCGHCMVAFPQWVTNAHGQAGINPRFFSLYNGTDISGTAVVAPGFKLDLSTAGNCATCHAPGAAANRPFTADMNDLAGVEQEGVLCDFCHKVADVYLDSATGLPYPNMPGVQSMQLNRPPSDTHMFYGPFDDVTRRVSYLALEKKSQFCAPCHQFSFWGTPIYESFREWLESPYASQGIECQACHMAPTGVDYFVFPEKGGLIRDPELIASHLQPGASDQALLQDTVTMTLSAWPPNRGFGGSGVRGFGGSGVRGFGGSGVRGFGGSGVRCAIAVVQVAVTITNHGAGHHVPTDFPGRHMILVVTAVDAQGQPLPLREGSVVPDWGGAQAGMPGKAFAKVLRDVQSGAEPVVSYWKQALIASDNRIPAMGSDVSTYAFAAPAASGPVTVTAELRFRRAFQVLMDEKGWDTPDIVMERAQTVFSWQPSTSLWWDVFLPLAVSTGSQSPASK